MKSKIQSLFLALFLALASAQLLSDGKFCNVNEDCVNSCCLKKRCTIKNNCIALKAMDDFVKSYYCDLNVYCESKCCLFGICQDYSECF